MGANVFLWMTRTPWRCPLLMDGETDVEGAARLAGVSVRTMQRLLEACGTNYRTILSKARYEKASDLLEKTSLPVAEVSARLGYSSHSHFVRAFRKWAGNTPAAARRASIADQAASPFRAA